MNWTCPNPSGWWPKLNYPWIAYGNRAVEIANLETGEVWNAGIDGYPHGWIKPNTLFATRMLEPDTIRHTLMIRVPEMDVLENPTNISELSECCAGHDHWAAWYSTGGISYDTMVIASGSHGVRQDATYVVARSIDDDYALRVYHNGVYLRSISKWEDVTDWNVLGVGKDEGLVVYGYPKLVAAYPGGAQRQISRSPWGEGTSYGGLGSGIALIEAEGKTWLWTVGGIGEDQWGLIGGVLGEPEVMTIPVPGVAISVNAVGEEFVVAACDDRGKLEVRSIRIDSPRSKLELPKPKISFQVSTTSGPVPLEVVGALTAKENVTTWRWLKDDIIDQPDGERHKFIFTTPGEHLVGIRAAGPGGVTTTPLVAINASAVDGKFGLNTFGLIQEEWAKTIAAKGWMRVRVEGTDYVRVNEQCARAGLKPLWILKTPEEVQLVPPGSEVEILNEPNFTMSPSAYQALVRSWLPALEAKNCIIYAGCVSNQSKADHAWIHAALSGLPAHIRASGHRYPGTNQDPNIAKKGYTNRAAELAGWLSAINGRKFAMTEIGFHSAPWTTGWWFWRKRGQRTDGEILAFLHAEYTRYLTAGAEFVITYQLNDGPSPSYLDHYGIRTLDGVWKPQADLPHL